jgi:hypothetical protein
MAWDTKTPTQQAGGITGDSESVPVAAVHHGTSLEKLANIGPPNVFPSGASTATSPVTAVDGGAPVVVSTPDMYPGEDGEGERLGATLAVSRPDAGNVAAYNLASSDDTKASLAYVGNAADYSAGSVPAAAATTAGADYYEAAQTVNVEAGGVLQPPGQPVTTAYYNAAQAGSPPTPATRGVPQNEASQAVGAPVSGITPTTTIVVGGGPTSRRLLMRGALSRALSGEQKPPFWLPPTPGMPHLAWATSTPNPAVGSPTQQTNRLAGLARCRTPVSLTLLCLRMPCWLPPLHLLVSFVISFLTRANRPVFCSDSSFSMHDHHDDGKAAPRLLASPFGLKHTMHMLYPSTILLQDPDHVPIAATRYADTLADAASAQPPVIFPKGISSAGSTIGLGLGMREAGVVPNPGMTPRLDTAEALGLAGPTSAYVGTGTEYFHAAQVANAEAGGVLQPPTLSIGDPVNGSTPAARTTYQMPTQTQVGTPSAGGTTTTLVVGNAQQPTEQELKALPTPGMPDNYLFQEQKERSLPSVSVPNPTAAPSGFGPG